MNRTLPNSSFAKSGNTRKAVARTMLAALFACAAVVPSVPASPAEVPHVSAGVGPCTADFLVTDTSNKPIYDAKVHLKITYGFMGKRDQELDVGTDSDGRARMEGLPDKLKKPPMVFTIYQGTVSQTVSGDPQINCHPNFSVTLGK
jgi:hypothetical protein